MADTNPINPVNPQAIKSYQALGKAIGTTGTAAKDLVARLAKAYDLTGKNTKANKDFFESVSQVKKETGSLSDAVVKLSGEVKKLSFDDALKSDKAVKLQQKLKDIHNEIQNIGKEGSIEDQKNKFKELRDEAAKVETEINNIKDSKIGLSINTKSATEFFQNISKGPEMMNLMGGAAKGLGSALGSVSKTLGGWPMLIFAAVKAVWDVSRAADQFVKDANEAFSTIRGPDIMTSNIKKQFKDFNEQIYNAGENIRVGLDPKEVRGFLESISAAGANITQLNKGLDGYRDAVYVAAKASKTLGTSLPWVGNEIAGLITNFHMDMDKIDKTFVQVAFDAKKSGLSTDRFWATVKNATASLAFYGVTIGSASKTLKRFTEDAIGSSEDASAATEDIYNSFKEGSLAGQAALLDFAGSDNAKKAFKEMADKFAGQIQETSVKIQGLEEKPGKTPEDVEELKKLRTELINLQTQQQDAITVSKQGSVLQATQMGLLADKAPKLIIDALEKGYGPLANISPKTMASALSSVDKIAHISPKTFRLFVREVKNTQGAFKLLKQNRKFNEKFIASDEDTRKSIAGAVYETGSTTGEAQTEAGERLSKQLQDIFGLDEDQADLLASASKTDKAQAEKMADLIKKGDKDSLDQLYDLLTSAENARKTTEVKFGEDKKTDSQMAKKADDTFEKIVDQTLSTNKILDIAKSEVEYRENSLRIFSTINNAVDAIARHVAKSEYKTASEKNALKSLGRSNISAKEQGEMVKKSVQTIASLEEMDKSLAKISDVSESKSGNVASDIMKSFGEASKSANAEQVKALLAVRQSPEIVAAIKEISDIENEDQSDAKKKKSHDKRLADARIKYEGIAKKKLAGLVKDNSDSLGTQRESLTNLKSLNTNNETIAKIEQLKYDTDKTAQSDAADMIQDQLDQGKSISEIASKFPEGVTQVAKILKSQTGHEDAFKKVDTYIRGLRGTDTEYDRRVTEYDKTKDTPPPPPKPMAKGGIVTKSTLINAGEAGPEAVIPLNKANPAGMGGGSKNITITVNATERDLGQKIADKINTALYNWQLAG